MHKDYKQRRAAIKGMQARELRLDKQVNKRAYEKFREKPYQQRYAEKLSGGGRTNDDS